MKVAKNILIVLASLVTMSATARGQAIGDYQTAGSGNWNVVGTWQTYTAALWVAAVTSPTSTNGVITIGNGHTVTVTANVTVDQVVVASGGQVTVNSGVTLTVANSSTNPDLNVSGKLVGQATGVIDGAGEMTLQAGATLETANTSGVNGTIQVSGSKNYNSLADYTFNGTSAQVTGTDMPTVVNNLTINNSGGVTLSAFCTVDGTFTLTSGNLMTGGSGSGTLTISSTGLVSRTSGYVIGNFKKNIAAGATSKTFEVGTANGYSPVTVAFGSVSVAGDLTAVATQAAQPNAVTPNETLTRYWSFTNSGITFDNYSATFSYLPADFPGVNPPSSFLENTDEAGMVVGKYASSAWTFPTIGIKDATNNTIQVTGVTSFSDFAIGKNDAALPVELTSFTALVQNKTVNLEWSTATEVNNYGFNVEWRMENVEWRKIGFVQGHGNSNSPKSYSFEDKNPRVGKLQYRLKQIDFDGAFEYSDVVEVEVEAPKQFVVYQNYPNPFNPTTNISYEIPVKSNVVIKVYNVLGSEVATLLNEEKLPGRYQVEFKASHLPSGIYFYSINAGEYKSTKKMILLK